MRLINFLAVEMQKKVAKTSISDQLIAYNPLPEEQAVLIAG